GSMARASKEVSSRPRVRLTHVAPASVDLKIPASSPLAAYMMFESEGSMAMAPMFPPSGPRMVHVPTVACAGDPETIEAPHTTRTSAEQAHRFIDVRGTS